MHPWALLLPFFEKRGARLPRRVRTLFKGKPLSLTSKALVLARHSTLQARTTGRRNQLRSNSGSVSPQKGFVAILSSGTAAATKKHMWVGTESTPHNTPTHGQASTSRQGNPPHGLLRTPLLKPLSRGAPSRLDPKFRGNGRGHCNFVAVVKFD